MAVTSSRRAMCHVRFKASGHPPRLPPDGRSCKFAKEGHTGPAPAGFYFAPRGACHGLGAYRRLHDDRYRHCAAGADFPLYGALTRHDDRVTFCARVSLLLAVGPSATCGGCLLLRPGWGTSADMAAVFTSTRRRNRTISIRTIRAAHASVNPHSGFQAV
jgi:hypothetical protein